MIKVDNSAVIPQDVLSLYKKYKNEKALLKFTYADMVQFFGSPVIIEDQKDRRVQWTVVEKQKDGLMIYAIIHDAELDKPLAMNFAWYIENHVSRSHEIVGEYIDQKREEGLDFVSNKIDAKSDFKAIKVDMKIVK